MRPRTTLTLTLALAVSAAAQEAQWARHRPLPRPSGIYAIGTYVVRVADTAHFPNGRDVERSVEVQVWYPARHTKLGKPARYVDNLALLDSMITNKYLDLPASDIHRWDSLLVTGQLEAPALPAPNAKGWPLLVFSHGFGVSRVNYTALIQELASHGYVVLALDHPYGGFMLDRTGRVLQPGGDSLRRRLASDSTPVNVDSALAWDTRAWAFEAGRSVRQIAQDARAGKPAVGLRVDTTHVGMLGHSLGGAAALQSCLQDSLFRACADLDGLPAGDVEHRGVGKPLLVLLSQPGSVRLPPKDSAERKQQQRFAQMGRERDSTFEAVRARNLGVFAAIAKLKGTGHMSFSDALFSCRRCWLVPAAPSARRERITTS